MHVGFLPIDLARWDQARPSQLLSIGLWSDVRPLRGASGLLDWRMCGKLSSLMVAGKVGGAEGEQTLLPSAGRLAWKLILAAGLGRRADFSEKRFRAAVRRILKTMRGLQVTKLAMVLPGRDGEPAIAARRALELIIAETEDGQPGLVEDLVLIEPPLAQKEMAELIRQRGIRKTPAKAGSSA